ncbi:MAG: 4Fe-4S dicluster domain-containing protein [Actinobacteria bacterium]|nr:4Fe-4S dicluster domain-containing protein [Actinomycetota bacterium]
MTTTPDNWLDGISRPATDDIVNCVACGLCLPHCPTFRVSGVETSSPRGRIAAMRAVDEGRATMDTTFVRMMDECLACRACEAACPSGVPYGRMIEAARAQVEPSRPAAVRGVKRLGLGWLLPRPRLVRFAAFGLGLAQVLRVDRLLSARLRVASPRVGLRQLLRPLPTSIGQGPRAAVLTGCVMDGPFRSVNRATLRVTARAGYRAEPAPGCCGALAMHYGLPDVAKRLAKERVAQMEGAEVVVINSAGCGAHMTTYGELLHDEPGWAARAEDLARRVRDVVSLAAPPRPRAIGGPMAVHDACHHLHAQGIGPELREIVRDNGGRPVEVRDAGRCCGAAGLYAVTQPEIASELRRQKAEAIVATGAPVVVVANPGCAIQIASGLRELGSDVRVVHPAEIMQ